jgi:Secretion system C-terminal sorting domain
MKTKILLIIVSFSTIVNSQTFTRKFPVTQSTQVFILGNCAPIVPTSDGGYILNYSYGYPDIHGGPIFSEIIKTDANFLPIWKKELWGSNGKKTFAFNDGSTILFENGFSLNSFSFNLEKFGSNGQTIWRKFEYETYPNKISIQDAVLKDPATIKLVGIKEINFGQYFGYSSQPIIMDFDLNGNYIQGISLSIPTINYGSIENICKETSGNYYVVIKNLTSRYIAKFSPYNTLIWCKNLSFNNYYFYNINTSIVLNNGDLLIGGSYDNYSSNLETFALVRITTDGNLVWSRTINDFNTSISSLNEITINEIVVTGTIYENHVPRNVIMKIDGNGNSIWAKKYSNAFSISEIYQKTTNDWYYSAFSYSMTESNPYVFNTENNGNTTCNKEDITFNFINNPASISPAILTTNSLTILTPSSVYTGQSNLQTFENNCIPLLSNSNFNQIKDCKIFPNPSNGQINILSKDLINKITLSDILGQKISEFYPNATASNFIIQNSGIYLITVETEIGNQIFKVIITN